MVRGTVKVSATDKIAALQQQLKELARKEVLVGITEDKAARQDDDKINNAELLYVHTHGVRQPAMRKEMKQNIDGGMKYSEAHSLYLRTHGSPLMQVPPRPVIEPAIEDKKEEIARQLGVASKAALDGNPAMAQAAMEKAGMIGADASQGWFDNPKNGWTPLAESTLQKREKKKNNRDEIIPLVDTDQMRKAIAYTVRDKA